MKRGGGRRGRWLALFLAAGVAGWAGWRDNSSSDPSRRPDDAGPPGPQAASAAAPRTALWGKPAVGPAGHADEAPDAPVAAAVASEPGETMEICGHGRISTREFERSVPIVMAGARPPAWAVELEQRSQVVINQLATRLSAGTALQQTAARVLKADPEGAALLAFQSGDAAAYRLAFMACGAGHRPDSPQCQRLTVQGWADRDPADARPWLELMAAATRRRDEPAASLALEQVLQRDKRSPTAILVPVVAGVVTATDDPAGLGLAMVEVIGREAALPDGVYGTGGFCSAERVGDAVRRAQCARLVRWQFKHADTSMDASLAVSLADRLGLPSDARPYTREQLGRGSTRLLEASLDVLGNDCGSLARTGDWVVKAAQSTELSRVLEAAAR